MYKNILILKIILLSLFVFYSNSSLKAEPYQFEIAGDYEYGLNDSSKSSFYMLGAAAYFEQISTEGRPLAEAAFIQKTGYLSVIGIIGNSESTDDYKLENNFIGFNGHLLYVLPTVPIFFLIDYIHLSSDTSNFTFDITSTINVYEAGIGFYLTDNFAILVDYSKMYRKTEMSSITDKDTETTIGGALKYVLLFGNGMGINIEAGYNYISFDEGDGEDEAINKEYELLGDLYFTPAFSIGGGIEINKGDIKSDVGKTYMVRTNIFITQNIAVGAQFQQFIVDDSNEGDNSTMFGVYITGRI